MTCRWSCELLVNTGLCPECTWARKKIKPARPFQVVIDLTQRYLRRLTSQMMHRSLSDSDIGFESLGRLPGQLNHWWSWWPRTPSGILTTWYIRVHTFMYTVHGLMSNAIVRTMYTYGTSAHVQNLKCTYTHIHGIYMSKYILCI